MGSATHCPRCDQQLQPALENLTLLLLCSRVVSDPAQFTPQKSSPEPNPIEAPSVDHAIPARSKKDFWDKLDIIGKAAIALITAIAAVVIPVVVTRISGQVQNTVTEQNTGKDYIQIALGILEKKELCKSLSLGSAHDPGPPAAK